MISRFVEVELQKLIPIACAVGLPIRWVSVSLLLSHLGGWTALAKRYADREKKQGATYFMRSGNIGVVSYQSCLTIRVCEDGLGLSVLFPIRFGHPPLFIPWDQFHCVSEKRVFFFRFVFAYVGMPVVVNVILPIWIRDHLPTGKNNG